MMKSRTVTKCDALKLGTNGGIVYHITMKNADGSAFRARVNGRCQVWKTRPKEFKLPMKHGLRTYFDITHDNCDEWLLEEPKDV
jgi:hypothetical protein